MAERPFGHEPSAIAVRRVLVIGAILALVVLTSVVVLHFVLRNLVMPDHAQAVLRPVATPPEPRLQPSPQEDLATFHAEKKARLSQYAWVDASHTYARTPIVRAMQIYVQQHAQPASGATAGASQ